MLAPPRCPTRSVAPKQRVGRIGGRFHAASAVGGRVEDLHRQDECGVVFRVGVGRQVWIRLVGVSWSERESVTSEWS